MEAHLLLESKVEMIGTVTDFTYKWCVNMGFDEHSSAKMALSVDEILTDIVLYAFKDEKGYVEIWYQYTPSEVEIIIQEKGEPFDPEKHSYNREKAIAEGDYKGASLETVRKMTDHFLFLNRGKDGKEYRLVQKYSFPHILDLVPTDYEFEKDEDPESEHNYLVTPVTSEDAEDIAKLIYRSYSYSYPKEDLYFPRRIETAIYNEYKYGTIVRTESGRPVGYFAVVKSTDSMIGEVTEAVVSPQHRNRGLMKKMMLHLIEMSRSRSLSGLFGMAMTNHLFSQKVNSRYGFKSTALIISKTGKRTLKGMEKSQLDMISVILDFLPLTKQWQRPPCLPKNYAELLSEIYDQFEEQERSTAKQKTTGSKSEQTDMNLSINYESQSALITVKTYGSTFVGSCMRMLKSTEELMLTSLYIDLPLNDPYIDSAITWLKDQDFLLAGLVPFFHQEEDYLRMQQIYKEVNFSEIQTYSEIAGKLKKVIQDEYDELQKNQSET
ncbi:MAG: GNAT family N-acetyltransferase [Bacteroidetes bacterium]|jgi:anti-sigma regulatory factor (Ser/Thr protein kinase)/N-acetylglutamate synthase-like GNAT family acetyltransferase|nr:GNAT family N-acetyltransferase [Bacteroidota bacterium]